MLDGLTLKYASVTPVPVSEIEVLQRFSLPPRDLWATTDIPPAAIPPVSGENVTLKLTLCCGARVKGKVGPEKLKPVPVTLSWKIVRLVLPLLLTETGSVLLLPTVTSPKKPAKEKVLSGVCNKCGQKKCEESEVPPDMSPLENEKPHRADSLSPCSLNTVGDNGAVASLATDYPE